MADKRPINGRQMAYKRPTNGFMLLEQLKNKYCLKKNYKYRKNLQFTSYADKSNYASTYIYWQIKQKRRR